MRGLLIALVYASGLGCAPQSAASPSPIAITTSQATSTQSSPAVVLTPSPTRAPATPTPTRSRTDRDLAMVDAQRIAGERVRATLSALARRDGAALAAIAHPSKGVRFSPYAFVRPGTDVVLMNWEIAQAFTSNATRTWGVYDGRGDPIVLTFSDYHARFVYSRNFASATWTSYNHAIGSGNSIDNSADIYPDAIMFEAYDPGADPRLSDVQWQSLRLFFERSGPQLAELYLVAIVHAAWTI